MRTGRRGLSIAIAAGCALLGASLPTVPGAEVGFWAHLDATSFTPEVWDALESTGGSLYLELDYGTAYGPAGSGVSSPLAVDVIHEANQRGIPVNGWLIVSLQDGTFAHENNAELIRQAVEAMPAWTAENGLRLREITLDLEFPTGEDPDPTHVDPGALRANIDPVHQCQAMTTYRDTITWAHQHGIRITGAPAPFFLDDLEDGYTALQDALDGVAFPPLGYDTLYLQAYRTYSDNGPGYVARYYRDMQRYFGAAGQVTIGDTTMGPPYDTLPPLVDDVRMLAGMGASRIPVFELGGTVSRFGADGVRAIVEAGRQPMSEAELATATQETELDRQQRNTFRQWDAAAVAATNAVTAPPGAPDGPNAYPDGCGDMHALPEPGLGVGALGAIPLLGWLQSRRRR